MKVTDIFEGVIVPFEPQRIKAKKELEALSKTQVYGSYAKDAKLWDKLEKFIISDSNPMEYRIEALKKLDKVHGYTRKSYSEKDVAQYIKDLEAGWEELQR